MDSYSRLYFIRGIYKVLVCVEHSFISGFFVDNTDIVLLFFTLKPVFMVVLCDGFPSHRLHKNYTYIQLI